MFFKQIISYKNSRLNMYNVINLWAIKLHLISRIKVIINSHKTTSDVIQVLLGLVRVRSNRDVNNVNK